MSLFNNLFGFSDESGYLLGILKLTENDIPRFRDCYYDTKKELICVHTRTGGGNRDFYENEETCCRNYPEYFENPEETPTTPWNDDLRENPFYVSDEDDSFDCTYASFYFKVPEEYVRDIEEIFKDITTITPAEKWKILFQNIGDR